MFDTLINLFLWPQGFTFPVLSSDLCLGRCHSRQMILTPISYMEEANCANSPGLTPNRCCTSGA